MDDNKMDDNVNDSEINKIIHQPKNTLINMFLTMEEYKSDYWPKLESAIQLLLLAKPGEHIPVSYEQVYSCVYKCVCKQFSETLYNDLIRQISIYLENLQLTLQADISDSAIYIENFQRELSKYINSVQGILMVFTYMNRFYVITKKNSNLTTELHQLFVKLVSDIHAHHLIPIMEEFQQKPFSILPNIMQDLTKNLYLIKPAYAQFRPQLFAKYVPNALPPCTLNDFDHYVQEAQQMGRDLKTHPEYISGDQSKKRSISDE